MDWREEVKLERKAQEYYEKEFSYNQVYIQGYLDGYAKGIDEFAEELLKVLEGNIDMYVWCSDIKRIAEQMKAGGIDG